MPLELVQKAKQAVESWVSQWQQLASAEAADSLLMQMDELTNAYGQAPAGADQAMTQMFNDAFALSEKVTSEIEQLMSVLAQAGVEQLASGILEKLSLLEQAASQLSENASYEEVQEPEMME